VSGSGISWAVCKSAPHSRQITMPAPHHSVYYRPDALPAAQLTALKALKVQALKAMTTWAQYSALLFITQKLSHIHHLLHHQSTDRVYRKSLYKPAILPRAHTACSATLSCSDDRRRTNGATAAALTTARVCCDVPDATLVRAHAASNWMSGLTTIQRNFRQIHCTTAS